jgi:hypothetical protein
MNKPDFEDVLCTSLHPHFPLPNLNFVEALLNEPRVYVGLQLGYSSTASGDRKLRKFLLSLLTSATQTTEIISDW